MRRSRHGQRGHVGANSTPEGTKDQVKRANQNIETEERYRPIGDVYKLKS